MKQALALCSSFKSQLRRDSSCLWCTHKVGPQAPCHPMHSSRSALSSSAYCRHVQQPGLCIQRRGGDIRQLLARTARLSCPEKSLSEAATTGGGPPLERSPAALPRPEPRPLWRSSTRSATASVSPGPHAATHPSGTATGARDQSPSPRQRLRSLHATGRGRHTRSPHAGGSGVECQEKPRGNQTLRSPLKTVLLSSMIKELLNLTQQAVATEENKARMVKAEWLNQSTEWLYRAWNPTEKRLVVDNTKTPLQHTEIVRILNYLLENLTGESHSTLRLDSPPAQVGAAGSPDGHFCPRGVPSGTDRSGAVSQLRAPLRMCSDEFDRGFNEKDTPAAIASSAKPWPTSSTRGSAGLGALRYHSCSSILPHALPPTPRSAVG